MLNVIFVVTNEPNIAKMYFDKYIATESIEIVNPNISPDLGLDISSSLVGWVEENSFNTLLNFIPRSKFKENKYNIVFTPYSGLAYAVLRMHAGFEDINSLVVCINEKVPTQAVTNHKFNILLNGKFIPAFKFFKNLMEVNGLLGSSFESILDDIIDGKVHFLPEYHETLLGQIANG